MTWTVVDEMNEMDYGLKEIKQSMNNKALIEGNEMKHGE